MNITAEPVGSLYTTRNESDICELALGLSGLRVVVSTNPSESLESIYVEYHFAAPRGFRFLDEGDLIRYWEHTAFPRGFHLFKITAGGWAAQEVQVPGMLSITSALATSHEWFVCTTNGCLNVLSSNPPLVREFK